MSRYIHVPTSIPKQYQMMRSSLATVNFIKIKLIFRYITKGVSNHVSSNSDHKTKSYSCSNSSTKVVKNNKNEKIFWVKKCGNKVIKNRGRDFKLGQRDLKSTQRLQIGARVISNRVGIANRCRTVYGLNLKWKQLIKMIPSLLVFYLYISSFEQ